MGVGSFLERKWPIAQIWAYCVDMDGRAWIWKWDYGYGYGNVDMDMGILRLVLSLNGHKKNARVLPRAVGD